MKLLVLTLLCLTFSNHVISQSFSRNGIYLTKEDFDRDTLHYSSMEASDILTELPWGDLQLTRNGIPKNFTFGEFYGYYDRGHQFYAFGKRATFGFFGYYQILDTSVLWVYLLREPRTGHLYDDKPYFSLGPDSRKHSLTIRNLKRHTNLDPYLIKRISKAKKHSMSLVKITHGRTLINAIIADFHLGTENGKPELLIERSVKF